MEEKTLGDLLHESQKETLKRFESLPTSIKYISEQCVKCKRKRVELYDNGHLICEKCNWNNSTKEYQYNEFI